MPDEMVTDEIATENNSSDARSAEEFLFGQEADERAVEAAAEEVEEVDFEDVAGQDTQDSGGAEGEAGPTEELKVVVSVRGGRATIGVQQPSADPHIESFDGLDLPALAQEVPAVVDRARARWEDEPRYPAHERPAAPARRQRRRQQEPAQASTVEGEGEEEQQQPETLRLF